MFLRPNLISVPLFGITQGRGAPRQGMEHPGREEQHPAPSSWESGASQALAPALAMEMKPLAGTSCYPWLFWSLSVLTLSSHSRRCLDKIRGAGEKRSFSPSEEGPNQGLLGSAASEFPNSPIALGARWDTGTADIKGAV